jgi:hypothetical protein
MTKRKLNNPVHLRRGNLIAHFDQCYKQFTVVSYNSRPISYLGRMTMLATAMFYGHKSLCNICPGGSACQAFLLWHKK